jgi:hypothetical protein
MRRRRPRLAADTAPDRAEQQVLRLALAAALAKLPRRQREAVVLRYLADLPERDVAAALGISPGTVGAHVHRGLAALRQWLGEDFEEVRLAPTPDPLTSARLAETYRRAAAIKRRRLMVGGSLAVAILAAAGVAGVAWPGGGEDEVRTVAGPDRETTTTLPPPTTVTTAPGRATTTTTRSSSGATTATTAVCRNGYDPACGPFRWDPQPSNRPMDVEASSSPQEAKVGQEVVFTIRVRDDGPVTSGCYNQQEYGDGTSTVVCTAACVGALKYGPWDPPPPENGSIDETFRHTFSGPGTYTARFAYNVGSDCSFSPYRSGGQASVQVTVTP